MTALGRLTWLETKLLAREPFALIFTLGFPLVLLVVLTGSFQPGDPAFGTADPSDYYLGSYVGVVIGALGLVVLPAHVAAYRERGVLRRLRASSIPPWVVVGAQLGVGLAMAAAGALVLTVVGVVAFGAAAPASPLAVLGAFVLAALAFLALGFLLSAITRTARGAQAIGMTLFFPMWLLSGAGPPPEVMGEGMRQVSDLLPLTYAVRAIQEPWLGGAPVAGDLLLLGALLVVAAGLAARSLRGD